MLTTFAPLRPGAPPSAVPAIPGAGWPFDDGDPGDQGPRPRLLLRGELLAQGFTDNHIRRARREGALVCLGQGRYLPAIHWQELPDHDRYRVLLEATLAGLTGDPVISHRSAAIVHGVTAAPADPPRVDITRRGPTKSRRGNVLRVHGGLLGPDEVVRFDRLVVTSLARTLVDCALTMPAGPAVALLRQVLAAGRVTGSELRIQLRRQERTPGIRAVAAVLAAALGPQASDDPAAQSATVISTAAWPSLVGCHS